MGWTNPLVISALAIGAIMLVLFPFVERDTGSTGKEDRHNNIFIKRKNGEILGSVKVLSLNIKPWL